jgi:hypothetical protein
LDVRRWTFGVFFFFFEPTFFAAASSAARTTGALAMARQTFV